jgi:hypothetical protein
VRGLFDLRLQHFENALDIAENLVVPNPNRPVSKFAQPRIASGVGSAVGMLPAIHLDDETPLATTKSAK